MRVICRHPVPVRYRPARTASDRLAFAAVSTPVEIPEAETAPEPLGSAPADGFVHEGVVYDRMTSPDAPRAPGSPPISPGALGRMLAMRREAHAPAFPPGSPLCALGAPAADASGSDLPRNILARSDGTDLTQDARSALARHVARTFLVHADGAFVRRRSVVIKPHVGGDRIGPSPLNLMDDRCGSGLFFEPDRFPAMLAYLKAMGYRGYGEKPHDLVERHRRETNGIPNNLDGGDLARWVNDAPSIVETIHRRATDRLGDVCEVTRADAAVARLRRFSALGLVGAVPPQDHPAAVEALHEALSALREAIPPQHPQPPLNWFLHYSGHVARPAVLGNVPWADMDPDDAAGIAALAPRG